jgi:hypothetical protein
MAQVNLYEKRGFMDDSTEDFTSEEEEGEATEKKPALVLNIYSWWTPILAIIMLVVGLAAGYYARPYVTARFPDMAGTTAEEAAAPTEVVAGTPQATVDPTQVAESRNQMMSFLVGQARHFIGDENAPITMIEFSDFQ